MKKITLLLICAVAMAFAEVHQGLKDAIDKGDYKTAKNLVQKMNVPGMYLPANLSLKDAESIYGKDTFLNYKCILDIYGKTFCNESYIYRSPEFMDRYAEMLCTGTSDFYVDACYEWMKLTKRENWDRIKGSFCHNKETVKACSLYVREQPTDSLYPILKELDKKGLLRFVGMAEIDTTVAEIIPKKTCLDELEMTTKIVRSSIAASRNATSGVHQWLGGRLACMFDYTQQAVNRCTSKLEAIMREAKKMCGTSKATRDVSKKIKVKRTLEPFSHSVDGVHVELKKTPWYAMDELWKEKFQFIMKYEKNSKESYYTEKEMARDLSASYSQNSTLEIAHVKRACIAYPSIDKTVSKKYGVDLFSCSKVLDEYPSYLNMDCQAKDSSWFKVVPLVWLQKQGDSTAFVCDMKTQKYRDADKFEQAIRRVCENSEKSWMDETKSVVCDKNVGWRVAEEYEKIGGLCDESATRRIYEYKDAYGRLKAIACDPKIGKYESCESPEKSWMKTYENRNGDTLTVVCDKQMGRFRLASPTEAYLGLCTEDDQGKEIVPLYTCLDGSWKDTKRINTDGLNIEKKFAKGLINPRYHYFRDSRDGQFYSAVKLGGKVWMAENANFATSGSSCYDNDEKNCVNFGRYYGIYEARNACPDGWHLPSKEEYEKLINSLGGAESAAKKLFWYMGMAEEDAYGFAAIAAGFRRGGSDYRNVDAYFWTSSKDTNDANKVIYLEINKTHAYLRSGDKEPQYSVRCVMD